MFENGFLCLLPEAAGGSFSNDDCAMLGTYLANVAEYR